jgi:hypothetical protein
MTTPRVVPAHCAVCGVLLLMEYPGQLTRSAGDGVLLCDPCVDELMIQVDALHEAYPPPATTPRDVLDTIDQAGWPRRVD